MNKNGIFSKLLKEPLLHFLLIGVGLFLLYAQLNNNEETSSKKEIIINKSKLEIISSTFTEEKGRVPTNKEMQEILEKDIREEILYYEAMAMGLDKDDKVIQHRLAEKMKYLFEDITILDEPSDEILKIYLQDNSKKFIDSSGNTPKYDELKHRLKNDWIINEQKKENRAFYKSLKSHYNILIDDAIYKEYNMSILK